MSEQELRPIVVGFDGSEPSHRALAWATRQGQVTGAPVEVLTTWQWPTNYGYAMAFETTYRPDDVAREMVEEVVHKAASEHRDVTFFAHIVEGEPRNVLVDRSSEAEMLVLGCRGHGELTGMLLGSVSGYCVTHAHCPVLVVRD